MGNGEQIENTGPEVNSSEENTSNIEKGRHFWKRVEPTIKIVIFVGVMMLFFFGTFKFYDWRTRVNTKRFLTPFEQTDEMIFTRINSMNSTGILTEEEKVSTLKTQYRILSDRKVHHRELAEYFVGNFYASILIVLFASVGGAIFIFVIASRGWARTNSYIKAVFFVLAFMAIFFAIFPNVFGQKGNFENNLEAFLRYEDLQIEIFNYLATKRTISGPAIAENEPQVPVQDLYIGLDSMISYVNSQIILMNKIYYTNGQNGFNDVQIMMESLENAKIRAVEPEELPISTMNAATDN